MAGVRWQHCARTLSSEDKPDLPRLGKWYDVGAMTEKDKDEAARELIQHHRRGA